MTKRLQNPLTLRNPEVLSSVQKCLPFVPSHSQKKSFRILSFHSFTVVQNVTLIYTKGILVKYALEDLHFNAYVAFVFQSLLRMKMQKPRNFAERHLLITNFCLDTDITNSTQTLKPGIKREPSAKRKGPILL